MPSVSQVDFARTAILYHFNPRGTVAPQWDGKRCTQGTVCPGRRPQLSAHLGPPQSPTPTHEDGEHCRNGVKS
jgi:hypothetical protein